MCYIIENLYGKTRCTLLLKRRRIDHEVHIRGFVFKSINSRHLFMDLSARRSHSNLQDEIMWPQGGIEPESSVVHSCQRVYICRSFDRKATFPRHQLDLMTDMLGQQSFSKDCSKGA